VWRQFQNYDEHCCVMRGCTNLKQIKNLLYLMKKYLELVMVATVASPIFAAEKSAFKHCAKFSSD
jgi:hypothetical protein